VVKGVEDCINHPGNGSEGKKKFMQIISLMLVSLPAPTTISCMEHCSQPRKKHPQKSKSSSSAINRRSNMPLQFSNGNEIQPHLRRFCHFSSAELLDAVVHLAWDKSERYDSGNVHLRAEDVHVKLELLANSLDVLETFLVVGACTTNPDLGLVLVELRGDFAKSADDTLERGGDL